jgi:hypothetical protein
MKTIPVAAAVLLLLATTHVGCVYVPTRAPEEWKKAMSHPAPSIAGTYRTSGEMTVKEGGYRIVNGNLVSVLNSVMADSSFCPPAAATRLQPVGKDRLEITALNDSEVVASKTIAADVGSETSLDGVRVARENNRKNSRISNLKTHVDAVLMKGADGFLYVRVKHRATATFAGLVPFGGGGEAWLRFPPAP